MHSLNIKLKPICFTGRAVAVATSCFLHCTIRNLWLQNMLQGMMCYVYVEYSVQVSEDYLKLEHAAVSITDIL